jgi:hypothetical protein
VFIKVLDKQKNETFILLLPNSEELQNCEVIAIPGKRRG